MLICAVAMAYYNNEHKHFGGQLILYQRNPKTKSASNQNKAFNWYMRIKVEGKKSALINKSTKCIEYEDAYLVAVEEFNRISTAVRLGEGIQTWTFQTYWEDWYKRKVDSGDWRDERANWHLKYFLMQLS